MQIIRLLQVFVISWVLVLPTESPAADNATNICRFGIPPWQKGRSFNEERKKYLPFLQWLSSQTNCKFVPVGATSYEDLIEKITTGKVHLAELAAVTYVQAKKTNPETQLLATGLTWNKDHSKLIDSYRSVIVSLKKHKNIETLYDLQGMPVGFVNQESSSGFVYPASLIREKDINHETYFSKTYFLGSHPNVTDAIVAGSIMAGATSDKNFSIAKQKHGDVFNVLWRSPEIPNVLIAAHPSLADSVRNTLIIQLPHVPSELLTELKFIKGFVVKPDSFYDVTRTVLEHGGMPD